MVYVVVEDWYGSGHRIRVSFDDEFQHKHRSSPCGLRLSHYRPSEPLALIVYISMAVDPALRAHRILASRLRQVMKMV